MTKLLETFGRFAIQHDAGRLSVPPAFACALVLLSGRFDPASGCDDLDAALDEGIAAFEDGTISHTAIGEAMNTVVDEVMKFGDEWQGGAEWN